MSGNLITLQEGFFALPSEPFNLPKLAAVVAAVVDPESGIEGHGTSR